ncbi:MAG: UDP-N-acetylmuramate dehydrogenase [Bermanella sp.]|jgi:UDP-N-acetylmuramate dehydrogenase
MKLETQYSLKLLNTLAIQSTAEYFVNAENTADVEESLVYAKQHNLEVKVLGGGSNVVMADQISGLVLKYSAKQCVVLSETESTIQLRVDAGLNWHEFVLYALEKRWYGLENLSYIPGSVGASPVQNIGAYGVEVKDFIVGVNGIYLNSGVYFSLSALQCEFTYRESCFKQKLNGQTLITSVDFELSKIPNVKIGYAPLNSMTEEQGMPTPKELSEWVIEVRKSKLPDPVELPNAGSFFKNPVISSAYFEEFKTEYPNVPNYPQGDVVKLPAGWLIDQLGLKGKAFGPVSVHKNQALVLINNGGTGADIEFAAAQIKRLVKLHYGIELEQEPRVFS